MLATKKKPIAKKLVAKPTPEKSKYTIEITKDYDDSDNERLERRQKGFRNSSDTDNGGACYNLTLKNINNDSSITAELFIIIDNQLSCGVGQMSGISGLEYFSEHLKTPLDKAVLIKALKKVFNLIKEEGKLAYIVASNNQHSPNSSRILDEICLTKTPEYVNNPNMGEASRIRVWIF